MVDIHIILTGILMASAMFSLFVFVYMQRLRDNRVAKYFAWVSLAIGLYSFGYGMELFSGSLPQMLFWNLVEYLGIPFIPPFWLIFTLEYSNKELRPLTKLGIFTIPVLTFILRYTNSFTHVFYLSVQAVSNHYFPVLYITKGPWYWVEAIYFTLYFIIANYTYVMMYRNSTGPIRRQCLLMLIASLLPWLSYLLDLLNLSPLNIDYGAFAVSSSLAVFTVAFLRYQFLNIKPLARDRIFTSTKDGIIVLDEKHHIIDYNPAATAIFPVLGAGSIGVDVRIALKQYQNLIVAILNSEEFQYEGVMGLEQRTFRVKTVKILSKAGEVGFVATFTDITKYTEMLQQLNHLAARDPLTGVYNRRHFVELSERELEKSRRYGRPLSFIILDLDFFKQINDTYGHQAGDTVLQIVADICRNSLRSTDILGRYGGEEFVIFMPETKLADCQAISDRILSNITGAEVNFEGIDIKVTASLGITGTDAVTDEGLDYFLRNADLALYQAKSDGRNCVRTITDSVCKL